MFNSSNSLEIYRWISIHDVDIELKREQLNWNHVQHIKIYPEGFSEKEEEKGSILSGPLLLVLVTVFLWNYENTGYYFQLLKDWLTGKSTARAHSPKKRKGKKKQ